MYKVGFMVGHQSYVPHAEVLVESIKSFGGILKETPIAIMTPKHKKVEMNIEGITQVEFTIPRKYQRIPYVDKMYAAMNFEQLANGPILWMDVDSIVLQEPKALEIDGSIGISVVDKKNIGLAYEAQMDEFWTSIYGYFEIEKIEKGLCTTIGEEAIKPYFNAGLVAVKAEKGLFDKVVKGIEALYKNDVIKKKIQSSKPHSQYFYQAVLTGAILSSYDIEDISFMNDSINYPLHLKNKHPRKFDVDEIQTLRYDNYFDKSKGLPALKHIIREKEQYLGRIDYY